LSPQMEKAMPKKTVKKTAKKTVKKIAKKVVQAAPPVALPVPVAPLPPVKSVADTIWELIQNLPIQMFGLPDQIVAMHATPVPIEPSTLYVTVRSSATLPSLEAAIAPAFTVELIDKFIAIRRAPAPLGPQKKKK